MNFDDRELHYTMEEFLDEDQNGRKAWNFATITGLVIIFLTFSYVMQTLIGRSWGPDLSGIIRIMPVIGGVLLIIVGFGFLAGDKRKKRSHMLRNDIEAGSEGNRSEKKGGRKGKTESDEQKESADFDRSTQGAGSSSARVDQYGLRQHKKLYKSRTDKKLCGVCGGLSKYFGISSTMVRLIFVVLTLIGWGSAAILYVALCIVLKKEPFELMDDFEEQTV